MFVDTRRILVITLDCDDSTRLTATRTLTFFEDVYPLFEKEGDQKRGTQKFVRKTATYMEGQ